MYSSPSRGSKPRVERTIWRVRESLWSAVSPGRSHNALATTCNNSPATEDGNFWQNAVMTISLYDGLHRLFFSNGISRQWEKVRSV